MSEYTVNGPLPDKIKQWCQKNHRYLVIGAKDPVSDSDYFNTAFVIGPTGETIFKQAKSVPIQFFKDGLPAKEAKIMGLALGQNWPLHLLRFKLHARDGINLVGMGAQAIIVPTMDVVDWGRHQHGGCDARVAPTRAAEYGVPIFRLAAQFRDFAIASTMPEASRARHSSADARRRSHDFWERLRISRRFRQTVPLGPLSRASSCGDYWTVIAWLL